MNRFLPIVLCLLCVLSSLGRVGAEVVLSPNGVRVPTLQPDQKAYLSLDRKARFKVLDNPAERQRLFAVGGLQPALELTWPQGGEGPVELAVCADGGERQLFTLAANATNAWIANLCLGQKYLWTISTVQGGERSASFETEMTPPRLLRADGVSNFRDLGGWRGLGGRRVRQNKILRSAGLRNSSKNRGGALFNAKYEIGSRRVTEAGLATLRDEFHIKTDMELRSQQECAGMTGSLIAGAKWVHVPFVAYDFIDNMVRGKEPFAKIFGILADEASYPVLMHCSGGRDRTGTLAFLLNGLLGVSEEDLLKDWEFSAFDDQGMKFNSGRIARLLDYLHTLPGENITEQIEAFVRSCGVTDQEVTAFREIMLEK